MMQRFINPTRATWKNLSSRPRYELSFLESSVRNILARVKQSGDGALLELTKQYDKVALDTVVVSEKELTTQAALVSPALQEAIQQAAKNITAFHVIQKREVTMVETMPGVTCWRKGVPIQKVGIYIPGGTAPLFSTVLMLAIPAKLAGCEEIILCTPPDASGKIHPAICFAATITGITKVFKVGGAQAIAAMTYGTESIPAVYKIFGPGNQFVTKAKQMVREDGVAIDMPAGPSEVLVMADEEANPEFVAADLLSQAEHGEDSQVMLVTTQEDVADRIAEAVKRQVEKLPRQKIAEVALSNSRNVIFTNQRDAIDFINTYAPEHLILNTTNARQLADQIYNAGSVFIGNYTPEAAGDYASGTNHTLPTNGYATAYAGVSLESFMKYITFQELTKEGLQNLGPVVEKMAEAEMLIGHKEAISIRLNEILKA